MKKRNAFVLLAAGGFFTLSVIAAGMTKKEIYVATGAPKWGAETILDQPARSLTAYSTRADYAVIDACLRITTSVESLVLPNVVRVKRAQSCQLVAETVLETSQQNSYAWFALASFSHISGGAVSFALEQSYANGPNEQWIAEQRVPLAEAIRAELSDVAMQGHMADLAMLVQSRRGIRAIASRFVEDPGFRDRITAIVEALPAEDQRRFLTVLQREIRGR